MMGGREMLLNEIDTLQTKEERDGEGTTNNWGQQIREGEGEEKRGDLLEGINNGVRRYETVAVCGAQTWWIGSSCRRNFQFLREIDHGTWRELKGRENMILW
jgi:hypothetical protein